MTEQAAHQLGAALYKALSGRQYKTEVSSFNGALRWITGRHPSTASAARDLGVAPSTLRRWLSGGKPRAGRADTITDTVRGMQRRVRMPKARERKLRASAARDIRVTGTYSYDADERSQVNVGRFLDPAINNELVDAFLAGAGPQELAGIFHENILDQDFYARTFDPGNDDPDDVWEVREILGLT